MDAEKVIQDLNRRFSEPLPEFYNRRIIFWYDEEQEFADKVDELLLDNAKILRLTGSNTFTVKKTLSCDDPINNYLVYAPFSRPQDENNWLLDVFLYSEEFHADLISIWMTELGLDVTPSMRTQVKNYRKFFNAKERRQKLLAQPRRPVNPNQLSTAVIAAICGLKDTRSNTILRTILRAGLDKNENKLYQSIVSYEAEDAFWLMAARSTGYSDENPSLQHLAAHIVLTAATKTIRPEHLVGLNAFISTPHQFYCYDFVSEWLGGVNNGEYRQIAQGVEQKTNLTHYLQRLSIDELVSTECLPCIDDMILVKLMTDISNDIIDIDAIVDTVERRKVCVWFESFACFYEGVLQIANMQRFFLDHAAGFHTVEPAKVWEEYTSEYYKMDTYYRLFQGAFQRSLESTNILLDDLFKKVTEKAESIYRYWFLNNLSANWTNACEDDFRKYGKVLDIPHQQDFYRYRVKNSSNRVFVIISDALRYEVGTALAEILPRELQGKVSLDAMQAIFPSYTKYGMAALLPHSKLSASIQGNKIAVLADGMATGSEGRDKVLKAAHKQSVALHYADIVNMKRADRSALVKGNDIVYIYHDVIDETGHDAETDVFAACDRAVSQMVNIVKIIVNDFGGTNVMITADHGFLYTYSPLLESDKVSRAGVKGKEIELSRRYVVTEKDAVSEDMLPVKFLDDAYGAFTPKDNVRIKMQGSGLNYVHGGISLQELVVPVVEYRHMRNDYAEYRRDKDKIDTKYVEVKLLSANKRICNRIFSLNFHQTEAVGKNFSAATYQIYLVDEYGTPISDTQRIIADKISEDARDRVFRCNFTLKPLRYSNSSPYYLMIVNEQEKIEAKKEAFTIAIALVDDDDDGFDF